MAAGLAVSAGLTYGIVRYWRDIAFGRAVGSLLALQAATAAVFAGAVYLSHSKGAGAAAALGLALVVLFALAYFGAGILGNIFYFQPEKVATFWPASGLFVAVLLLSRFSMWPVLVLAAIVSHVAWDVLLYNKAVATSLSFTAADVLEACTGAFLLRRFFAMSGTLLQLKEVLALAVVAGLCSTALGAVVGAAAVVLTYPHASYWPVWQVWWFADALGVLVVAPAILTWAGVTRQSFQAPSPRRIVEVMGGAPGPPRP